MNGMDVRSLKPDSVSAQDRGNPVSVEITDLDEDLLFSERLVREGEHESSKNCCFRRVWMKRGAYRRSVKLSLVGVEPYFFGDFKSTIDLPDVSLWKRNGVSGT